MDIHRCRFVLYPPSTINVLAFSNSQGRGRRTSDLRLAIGRANGDIEIWNPLNGAWLQETILRGGKDRSVDGLVWIKDPDEVGRDGRTIPGNLRLFSTGYTTTVTEWDLEKGQPLRQTSGNHGEIWCLAAQPPISQGHKQANGFSTSSQWQGQHLVTGCTDGAVVLYSTADQDLRFERVLARPSSRKAKVISINFQDRNTVVAGCTDSTIRVYDIRNGTLVRNMTLGAGIPGGPKEIIVWAVKCLPNGNIISGDSTGEVRIWDGKTYTLVQRIKSHRQDVLSLATSNDGTTILSGGMDRRTVIYKQVGDTRSRWGEVTHRRFHSHDVKTMATFEGKGMSIIVSGGKYHNTGLTTTQLTVLGPDASPIVIPLREFGMENQRMLPSLPQEPVVQSAPRKRLLMSWWDREVHIWHIRKLRVPHNVSYESDNESEERSRCRKLVAKVMIRGEANINSASISGDGNLLAVSTSTDIKLFHLKPDNSEADTLRISRLEVPRNISTGGARIAQFSPDGRWLCVVRKDNLVALLRVIGSEMVPPTPRLLPLASKLERLERKKGQRGLLGGLGKYDRTITRVTFSSDSTILAMSDLAGHIDTWVLEGNESLSQDLDKDVAANDASSSSISGDSDGYDDEMKPIIILGQHWIRNPSATLLPKLPSTPVVLSFRPASAAARQTQSKDAVPPHAPRNDPHSRSHDLPYREDRLLVVTATSQVLEFEVLRGGLTSWSRRNPTANFPEEYKGIRDQAMGCIWHVGGSRERVWLYGSNWMWMYDLSRDLPQQETSISLPGQNTITNGEAEHLRPRRKRKRGFGRGSEIDDPRKGTAGAGGKVPDSKTGIGISRKIQKICIEDDVTRTTYEWRQRQEVDDSNVNESDEENGAADNLGITLDHAQSSGEDAALHELPQGEDDSIEQYNANGSIIDSSDDGGPPHWWHTYKYRPIMGVVPLDSNNESADQGGVVEVAVVERPIWEVDLPPRYYGDQEWEKPGI
jgi:U3 small nucleolar RNA-associated protein 4